MSDEPREISILDARLADIDRRLSSIQTGLADDVPPEPPLPPAPEPPTLGTSLEADLRRLAHAHERLLQSTRELLAAYEGIASRLRPGSAATPEVREFMVSAGPFADTEALRGFEQTLARIPEVREVAVRGYEGEDRAIVDVQLFGPSP
jgi:hypothetical protein